jgi:hypothetical protein
VSIDQAEDFLAVVAQLFGQLDFGGQVVWEARREIGLTMAV